MKTKIYKIELMVVDMDNRRLDDIIRGLENCKYIHPIVMEVSEREASIDDDHPLTVKATCKQAFKELFEDEKVVIQSEYNQALDREADFG